MRYYKAYGVLKDGTLFTCYQPDCMSHPILLGTKYTAKEVQVPDEGMLEEDIQFYGVRTIEEVVPFMIDGYVDKDCGFTEEEWIDAYTYPKTFTWIDCAITLGKLVIVECEGTLKDDAEYGEELTFYDQTVLRIVREITNEELAVRIKDVLTSTNTIKEV